MKIEDNRKIIYFANLKKGTVFITDKYPKAILMKMDETVDEKNAIDLDTGYSTRFNEFEIVKPINAKLVLEN